MIKRKHIPSIAEQAAAGAEDLKAWGRGDLRFRTTIVAPDGSRTSAELKMSQPEFARITLRKGARTAASNGTRKRVAHA